MQPLRLSEYQNQVNRHRSVDKTGSRCGSLESIQMKLSFKLAGIALALLSLTVAQAQTAANEDELGTSDEVFASQGGVVLTQAELDAAINRIPAEYRLQWVRGGERVDQLVANLLRTKVIAAAAREEGYDSKPVVQQRMRIAGETELAEGWVQLVLDTRMEGDYEQLAREYYLANPELFRAPATLDVSHILLSSESRGAEEALELARSLREQVLAEPTIFDSLIMEYSDDPSKNANSGRFPNMQRGQMVREFEAAAFALNAPGQISEPVKTAYGYHLIRLNAARPESVRPFEDVKVEVTANVRQRKQEEFRVNYIKTLLNDAGPIEVKEDAVEAMLKRYYGENLELAPEISED